MVQAINTEEFDSFAECVPVDGGYTIRHKESLYEYFAPEPTPEAAWTKMRQVARAVGEGVGAMLQVAPVVTINLSREKEPDGRPRKGWQPNQPKGLARS